MHYFDIHLWPGKDKSAGVQPNVGAQSSLVCWSAGATRGRLWSNDMQYFQRLVPLEGKFDSVTRVTFLTPPFQKNNKKKNLLHLHLIRIVLFGLNLADLGCLSDKILFTRELKTACESCKALDQKAIWSPWQAPIQLSSVFHSPSFSDTWKRPCLSKVVTWLFPPGNGSEWPAINIRGKARSLASHPIHTAPPLHSLHCHDYSCSVSTQIHSCGDRLLLLAFCWIICEGNY